MPEDHLNSLLSAWEEQRRQGRDVPAAELCHDCPELLAELARRIAAVRRLEALAWSAAAPVSDQRYDPHATNCPLPPGAGDQGAMSRGTETPDPHATTDTGKDGTPAVSPDSGLPRRLGGYELLEVLGRGGMGVVYKARQASLNRLVALKMILAGGHAGPEALARFLREAETVARLKHPNVVQVHDYGSHEGTPYFSLEYLEGGSLADQLKGQPQPPARAAQMALMLARAVQAAHEQGIVHRDLKPANVLLAADGTPKVADFGLAKRGESGQTATREVLGTPSYMAPEQAGGHSKAVGPAADVYALGAILYECLTGRPPFQGETAWDTLQLVVGSDPVAVRQLQPKVPRDLETICLACLRKEPAQRYASAALLADDLQRFLDGQPVRARPVGLAERTWRWGRRNPGMAGLAAALSFVVVGSVIGLAGLWLRAERKGDEARKAAEAEAQAKDQAQRHLQQMKKGVEMLASVFRKLDPDAEEKEGKALRVQLGEQLQEAAGQLEGEAVGDPLEVARLQDLLGKSLGGLGYFDPAEKVLQRARATREQLLGHDDPDTLSTLNNLADLYQRLSRYDEAEALYKQVLEARRRTRGAGHHDTLTSMNDLATLYDARGRYGEAEALYKQALDALRDTQAPDHPDALITMGNLAGLYQERGRLDEAEALFKQVLEARRRTLPADHPDALRSMNDLAALYDTRGRYEKAEPLYKEALAGLRRTLGPDHPDTLISMNNLATMYRDEGRYAEAEPLFRQALKVRREKLPPDHPDTLNSIYGLATVHVARAQYGDADALLREAVAGARKKLGLDHPRAQLFVGRWAEVQAKWGHPEAAERLLREMAGAVRDKTGADSPEHAAPLALLAANLLEQHKYPEAESVARSCLAIGEKNQPQDWATSQARSLVGAALLGQGKYAAAEPLLVQGYQGLRERRKAIPPLDQGRVAEALGRLVALYDAWGQKDQADRWRQEREAARVAPPGAKKP
jgi:tetratricopeptide (TPR) repeat protein/tRNA A-37 threonylcarbamoyl transferase component Bud32